MYRKHIAFTFTDRPCPRACLQMMIQAGRRSGYGAGSDGTTQERDREEVLNFANVNKLGLLTKLGE